MGRSKCLCMRPAFGAGLDRELTGASCGSCLFSLTNKSIRQRADRRARLDDDHGARRAIERRSYRLFSRSLSLSLVGKIKQTKKEKKNTLDTARTRRGKQTGGRIDGTALPIPACH